MKSKNLFFILFVIGILVVAGLQIYGSVYSHDKDFNKQVENHLISTVQIKGERINDYFLERRHDVLVLADSVEVKELLQSEVDSDESVIGKNIEEELEIITNQIEIYVNKYPDMSFVDWQNDDEFQKIVARDVGETGYTSLVNYDIFDKTKVDYYKSTNVKTNDGVNLGIAAKVNLNEFKILDNASSALTDSMKRFKEISNYENLILIDSEGYVLHEIEEGLELGTNLEFPAYSNTSLGEAYFEVKGARKVVVYGPYLEVGETELVLLFVAQVFFEESELIGFIVLEDSMKDVNDISLESTGLGETGDSYIVDKDNFLITPFRVREADLLIQEIETENTKKCFDELDEEILYFEDYKGDAVIGSYVNIPEADWCLVAEIEEKEVFDAPKQGKIRQDLIVIFILNFILLVIVFILMKKINLKGGRK